MPAMLRDGVRDGVIDGPANCHFDPNVLLCNTPDPTACLTAPQVQAVVKIYAGPKDSRTG